MEGQSSLYTRREDFMARAGDGTRARAGGAAGGSRRLDFDFGRPTSPGVPPCVDELTQKLTTVRAETLCSLQAQHPATVFALDSKSQHPRPSSEYHNRSPHQSIQHPHPHQEHNLIIITDFPEVWLRVSHKCSTIGQ